MATSSLVGGQNALTQKGWVYLGPSDFEKLQGQKYNPASLRKVGNSYYLAPNESLRLGYKPRVNDQVVNTDVQYTAGEGFDPTTLAQQIAAQMRAASPSTTRPTFDASGLYNEADARAQAEAEFNPYFQEQGQTLETSLARAAQARARQQEEQGLGLQQSYLQRGLLGRTGGELANRSYLQQQQALQNTQAGDQATEQRKALTRKKAGAIEDYRTNAYNRAWQSYLSQFGS
jgi:hypothetical protein